MFVTELYTRLVLIFVVYSPTCRTSLHTSTHHTGNLFLGRVWHPESHSRCLDPNVRNPTILFPGTTDFILTILKGASIEAPWNSDFCLVCPKSWCKKKYMNLPTFPISSWQFSGRSRGQIDAVFSSFACTVGLGTFAPAYLPMHLGSDPKVICHLSRHLPAIKDGNGQSQHVCRWLSH
jgi:hypothetical protein